MPISVRLADNDDGEFSRRWRSVTAAARSRQSVQEVIAHTDRIGDRGERGVYRADADKEARVHHVEIVELVRLAVRVQDGALGIRAEAARSGLMRAAGDWDIGLHVEVARNEMARMQA